jgi:hypothetical protein
VLFFAHDDDDVLCDGQKDDSNSKTHSMTLMVVTQHSGRPNKRPHCKKTRTHISHQTQRHNDGHGFTTLKIDDDDHVF